MIADDATATGPPIVSANPDLQATKLLHAGRGRLISNPGGSNADLTSAPPRQPSPLLTTPLVGPRSVEVGPQDPGRAGGLRAPNQPGGAGDAQSKAGMAAPGSAGNAGPRVVICPPPLTQPPALNQGVEIPFSGPANGDPNLNVNGGALLPGPGHGKSVGGSGTGGSGLARDVLADQSTTPGVSLGPPPLEPYRPNDAGIPAIKPTPTPPPTTDDIQPPIAIPAVKLDNPEHLDDDFDYVLSTIQPTPAKSGYLRIDFQPKRTLHRLKTMPKDVVFLVDVSLSIPEEWATQVAQGVRDSLASLNAGDRFNIVLFNQAMTFNRDGAVPANPPNIGSAEDFLSQVHAAHDRHQLRYGPAAEVRRRARNASTTSSSSATANPPRATCASCSTSSPAITIWPPASTAWAWAKSPTTSCRVPGLPQQRPHSPAIGKAGPCLHPRSDELHGYPIIKTSVDVAGIDDSQVFPATCPTSTRTNPSRSTAGGTSWSAHHAAIRPQRRQAGGPDFYARPRPKLRQPGDRHLPRDWALAKLYLLYSQMIAAETPNQAAVKRLQEEYGLKTVY